MDCRTPSADGHGTGVSRDCAVHLILLPPAVPMSTSRRETVMTVGQAPRVPRRCPPPAVARAFLFSHSDEDNLPLIFRSHDPLEDAYVPPSPRIGSEFWPTHVRFSLDPQHAAWGDRQAKLEMLRGLEFLALRRPFHLPPIIPTRPDYKGLVTTARAGRRMTVRTWKVYEEAPRVYRMDCVSLGPWLTVRQRQERLEAPDYWIRVDSAETSLWMSTFGLHLYAPEPLERFLPDAGEEEVHRFP